MQLYAVLRRGGWETPEELEQAAESSRRVGDGEMSDQIRWIRSYVLAESDGELGTVCIYEAESPQAICRHAERAGLPVNEIVPIADTVIVRSDPDRAAV